MKSNDTNYPLISIILTTYNQRCFLRLALESALQQTYSPLEIIISDDASTDDSQLAIDEIVRNYQSKDNRHSIIVNYNETNLGICRNFEFAFSLCKGELVFAFGGDDFSTPDRVTTVFEDWVAKGRSARVLASGGWLVNLDGERIKEYGSEVMNGAPVGAFNAYHRCVFDAFPMIRADLAIDTYEDSVYGLRAQFLSAAQYVDAKLVNYRIGSGVSTGQNWFKKMERGALAVKASCEQLLIDLEHVKQMLSQADYTRHRGRLLNRISHETNFLNLLCGPTLCIRWLAFRRCGYLSLPIRSALVGYALLLPKIVVEPLIRFAIAIRKD